MPLSALARPGARYGHNADASAQGTPSPLAAGTGRAGLLGSALGRGLAALAGGLAPYPPPAS